MKTPEVVKRLLFITLSIAAIFLVSCSSNGARSDGHAGAEHTGGAATAAAPVFQDEKVASVYEHYIHVKNAMVRSDAAESQLGAAALKTALVETESTDGADLAGKIAQQSDIGKQRAEFDALTTEVEQLIKTSKLKSGVVFKQYCPMANEGNGAYWLASESEVRNPFFGDVMLNCGEVKEELK